MPRPGNFIIIKGSWVVNRYCCSPLKISCLGGQPPFPEIWANWR
jgi:hypothetical protein